MKGAKLAMDVEIGIYFVQMYIWSRFSKPRYAQEPHLHIADQIYLLMQQSSSLGLLSRLIVSLLTLHSLVPLALADSCLVVGRHGFDVLKN